MKNFNTFLTLILIAFLLICIAEMKRVGNRLADLRQDVQDITPLIVQIYTQSRVGRVGMEVK